MRLQHALTWEDLLWVLANYLEVKNVIVGKITHPKIKHLLFSFIFIDKRVDYINIVLNL